MARIPPLSRLTAEDFKEQNKWIDRLLSPINIFFERMTTALNRGLTIQDNFSGAIKTIEFNGTMPVRVAWDLPVRPMTVIVGNVYRTDGTSFTLTEAIQVQWSFNQAGQLQIDTIVGITPSATEKYKVVLECKTG